MVEQELLTVKEFSKAAGVTEQAVYKRLRNENSDLRGFVVEKEGKKFLKVEALETITEKKTVEKSEAENLREMVEELKRDKAFLQEQISSLQVQNKELTAALENTTASLQAAQALHAGTMQQAITAGESEDQPERKKGFFSRLFG